MINRAGLGAMTAVLGIWLWTTQRIKAAGTDESGSPTLETVVIAAGMLALAIGLVVVLTGAVHHYSSQIQ